MLHRLPEALSSYDRAIALNPDFAQAWNNKGNVLLTSGSVEAAIECYDRAIAIEPGYAMALRNRAMALARMGRDDEARRSLARASELEHDPTV